MGAVGTWLNALMAIFAMGLAYMTIQPYFDYGLEYMRAMGGHAANIASLTESVLTLFPYVFAAAMLIGAFIQSTKEEDNSIWR